MDAKRPKPMIFNWPLLSPRRPRSPSSFCSSSTFSSRAPSFSSDITEFYDAAEDWSENIEQATYYPEENVCDYRHPKLLAQGEIFLPPNLKAFNLKTFTIKKLKRVTKDFHHDRFIGTGGFGLVYKGWIDEKTSTPSRPGSGMAVAVKIWKPMSKIWNPMSRERHAEWQTEVFYLGQIRHPNVVKLIGFCSKDNYLALVYEYVQRGSLDNHLFKGDHRLSWTLRIKVAIGIAKGLSFLHDAEKPIILRDVTSSNVLLDAEFNAKLTDFGLAIPGPTEDETHIEEQVKGTLGYVAPEYSATGNLYVKSDVYGFGVVLLQLLSGLRVYDHTRSDTKRDLVVWAKAYLGYEENSIQFMDLKLKGQYPEDGAHEVAKLALQCLRDDPELRPPMSEVLAELEQLQHWNGTVPSVPLAGPH